MQHKVLYLPAFLYLLYAEIAAGQNLFFGEPVTITGSRISSTLSEGYRKIYTIDNKDIKNLPVNTLTELLELIASVNIRTRGLGNSQADISIRGSSFEQVLILVDGIRMNDPQTGHHSMDIPVPLSDIKRIEVLAGHASSVYGPDGYGGVVNIITKAGSNNGISYFFNYGSFRTVHTGMSCSFKLGKLTHKISFENNRSDGHIEDTDYHNMAASYGNSWINRKNRVSSSAGISIKNFGANNFYAPFPSREKTGAIFSKINFLHQFSSALRLFSRGFFRFHNDDFILDRTRESWYSNHHKTYIFGTNVQLNYTRNSNEYAIGASLTQENLNSSSLGKRYQTIAAVFAEMAVGISDKSAIDCGIRLDYHNSWGTQASPSLSFKSSISPHLMFRASAGRIFRIPTFTELFYHSPANQGNPLLKPETGWSAETGIDFSQGGLALSLSIFQRWEKDKIDWIRFSSDEIWKVVNRGRTEVAGLSISADYMHSDRTTWRINYTYLLRRNIAAEPYMSKYDFTVPPHNLTLSFTENWSRRVAQTLFILVCNNPSMSSYTLLNSKISFKIGNKTFYFSLNNILNTRYETIPNVIMPGRRINMGINYTH
ncbi:TonB-dependent receptor [bacterium]|nr:TonB-dependent receptor [bacterium]